jgi:uroporphyrin-III C-methyltransferase/precorrin-2 dehydrogenase/sirohydrochlorin ferrochelatase
VFVTGHGKDGEPDLNWEHLIQPRQTVVIYMGLMQLPSIVDGLLTHGARADIPAALVENGTREDQRVITGALKDLPRLAEGATSPALVIIGDVVTLHKDLSWFEGDAAA